MDSDPVNPPPLILSKGKYITRTPQTDPSMTPHSPGIIIQKKNVDDVFKASYTTSLRAAINGDAVRK